MPTLWNLSATETAFATAVKDASKWNIAMDVVASATGSFRAILLPVPQEKAPIIRLSESLRSTSEINYLDGWVQCDLGYRGVSKLVQDRVISNVDCGTPVEIDCDSLHPEALERVSLPYFAGVKVTADDKLYCLVIQRSIQQASFSAAELKDLANISSALSRAATEARALGLARAEGALSAFSVLGWPAVLLDHDGQLIHINQNAEQLLSGDVTIWRTDRVFRPPGHHGPRSRIICVQAFAPIDYTRAAYAPPAERKSASFACLCATPQRNFQGCLLSPPDYPKVH
jgi:hypothetical protein